MLLLLDSLLTLGPNKFYNGFKHIYIHDLIPVFTSYGSFLIICIFALGDEGGVDWEELDKRVRAQRANEEIEVPHTYRPVYYYLFFAVLPFFMLWHIFLPTAIEKTKPNTIFQNEYTVAENLYYAPHVLFFMYTCMFIGLIIYQYSEEDITHWDPKQEWKHSYLHAIMHQTGDWVLFFIFFLYPIYFFTYPIVEHTHTAYLFYFIIIFWAPFYSYYSYLPEQFEIVNPETQPSGEILDVPKMWRIRKALRARTKKYLKYPTMRLKKGCTWAQWCEMMGKDEDYLPYYDGEDLFSWQRYMMLFIVTTPVAFLMLYFA